MTHRPHFPTLGALTARTSHAPRGRSRSRLVTTNALLVVSAVTLVLALAGIGGPVRFVFGVVFALFVPGWSAIGGLRLRSSALELGLTVATSLAALMVLAQVMISTDFWHPVFLLELLCVGCSFALWRIGALYRRGGSPP